MSSTTPSGVTIGRMVTYRSKTGRYSLPAVVALTQDTLYEPGVQAGFVPPLSGPDNVHLVVFTSGFAGNRLPGTDPAIQADAAGGTYQEHDIPRWADAPASGFFPYDDQPPGTWAWPPRA